MFKKLLFVLPIVFSACSPSMTIDWKVAKLPHVDFTLGSPEIVSTKSGDAVRFQGKDAYFLNINPLNGMEEVTVEVVFKPESNAEFAQRFIHLGKTNGERIMIETRVKADSTWYLDTYTHLTNGKGYVLIDTTLCHPTDRWFTVSLVCSKDSMISYVNGVRQVAREAAYLPIEGGVSSIGVRQNRVCFFQGEMYRIRITPKALDPKKFLNDHLLLN